MSKFYLTTAIPYVNGKPHIGHALEYFQADTIRRYKQLLGDKTLLLSGSDENALKNVQAAEKEGVPVQEFLDRNSQVFADAFAELGVALDIFQRASDKAKHWPGVQKLWQLCERAGDIYKKSYTGLYCVGCEEFKNPADLKNKLCPIHQKPPEQVSEENYFFRLSKYQNQLVELIETNQLEIIPENKRNETLAFIKRGLEDFSISRSNQRARGVGVPVPGDDSQKIYVWFDALNIYMTGVGFGWDEPKWQKWWPADLHIIGKDISRFHTVYWPAMLLSAKISLPKQLLIHSFLTSGGQKMSKSLGNVIDPFDMSKQYGLEPLRYYLLSQIPIDEDGDFTIGRFKEVYSADLANGLGNLVSRVAKLCERRDIVASPGPGVWCTDLEKYLSRYQFNQAIGVVWKLVSETDKKINQEKPWERSGKEAQKVLESLVKRIQAIGYNLQPFLPQTAEKILKQFSDQIKSGPPLFPRLS